MEPKKIILTKDDCNCDILTFYENVASKLGYNNFKKLCYDCRKMLVTKNVFQAILDYYNSENVPKESFAMFWASYGPKAALEEDGYVVIVEDGFICKK